ncbi:ovate protein family [Artemisia annua]|uniref:Transcription repressor n=1 Tax=Artemisia annua TaxID=35608 RepID=A0A2U1PBP7_ARTAN|nr:ovate protein family [Artemisia annua]
METTNFKLKISRLFQSSFNSCRTKHISDVISGDQPFFFPENHHHHRQLIDLFSPKVSSCSKLKPHFQATNISNEKTLKQDNVFYEKKPKNAKKKKAHVKKHVKNRRVQTKKAKKSGVGGCKDRKATDVIPIKVKGKLVKDSVAIVKKSSDPHEDFRVSMLEMIVERQIFGTQDLENLLKCFLSLNSEEHHRIIFEVFTEIWETLFSDFL